MDLWVVGSIPIMSRKAYVAQPVEQKNKKLSLEFSPSITFL